MGASASLDSWSFGFRTSCCGAGPPGVLGEYPKYSQHEVEARVGFTLKGGGQIVASSDPVPLRGDEWNKGGDPRTGQDGVAVLVSVDSPQTGRLAT